MWGGPSAEPTGDPNVHCPTVAACGRIILRSRRAPRVESSLQKVITDERMRLFSEIAVGYERHNTAYFVGLLSDYVVRTRIMCVLVDLDGEDKFEHIAGVLGDDPNELVHHGTAFSLGRVGYSACVPHLERSSLGDTSIFIRPEAVITLGVVDNRGSREALTRPLFDPDEPAVVSTVVALLNIAFMKKLSKNEKFASGWRVRLLRTKLERGTGSITAKIWNTMSNLTHSLRPQR